jgi:hypothetical protein
MGSLTLTIKSAAANTSSAESTIFAPAAAYSESLNREPVPAWVFHQHLVSPICQLGDAVRLYGYPVLVVLDFLWDSYDQCGHAHLLCYSCLVYSCDQASVRTERMADSI